MTYNDFHLELADMIDDMINKEYLDDIKAKTYDHESQQGSMRRPHISHTPKTEEKV